MLQLNRLHHIAIICSDYERSKAFYTGVMGLTILRETYREARGSYKLDLALQDQYIIELFSFPDPPARVSQPEACGLRHLAFETEDIQAVVAGLSRAGIMAEPLRTDVFTGKRFTFISDPDGLPIEFYER